MAAPERAVAHTLATAQEFNQLIDLLEGAASMTEAFKLVASTGENIIFKLSDASGVRKLSIQDSAGAEVAYVTSTGAASFASVASGGEIIIPSDTAPAETTEGSLQWDSNDDRLVIGDGTGTQTFYPGITRWKAGVAGQNFTISTFADVAAQSGALAFSVAANKTYKIKGRINLTAVGTATSGGLKLALTHPASPAAWYVLGTYPHYIARLGEVTTGAENGATTETTETILLPFSSTTPGSDTAFMSANSGSVHPGGIGGSTTAGLTTGLVEFEIIFVNGATAGNVTLRGAQATAAGTTSVGYVFMSVDDMIAA